MNRDQIVAGGVALSAFACSAQHIYTVALAAGNPAAIAMVHPLGLDGLIYVGIRGISAGRRWQGWAATVYGIAMSLTFNGVSYAHVPMSAWVMAVAMPLALVLAVLVVGHEAKVIVPAVLPARVRVAREAVPVAVPAAVPVSRTVVARVPADDGKRDKALALVAEGRDKADVAATVGVSVRSLNRWLRSQSEGKM